MTAAFVMLVAGAGGCAKSAQDLVIPGQTSLSQLKSSQGEPENQVTPRTRPAAKVLGYPDGCKYQIERNIVVGMACPPSPSEVTLQYWRHKWKGDSPHFDEVPDSADAHGQKNYQLVSDGAHMAVVYQPGLDRVMWVVKYGAR